MAIEFDIPPYAAGQDQLMSWDFITEPDDITGWTLIMSVRERWGMPVLFTATIGDGLTITAASTGGMDVYLSSAKTKDLTPGCYVYEIWRNDAANEKRLTYGTLTLVARVTELP